LAVLAFPVIAAMRISDEEKTLVDTWLNANDDLDEVGNPLGTMYAGGTPLFDETTGLRVDKYEYILEAHPDKPWEKDASSASPPLASEEPEATFSIEENAEKKNFLVEDDQVAPGSRFPTHWGPEPQPQTRDYRELPGGYGFGSGTLIPWIEANMAKDAAETAAPSPEGSR